MWAIGVVLYRCLIGHFPFADEELGNAHAPNESVQIDHIEMLIESLVKTLKNIS